MSSTYLGRAIFLRLTVCNNIQIILNLKAIYPSHKFTPNIPHRWVESSKPSSEEKQRPTVVAKIRFCDCNWTRTQKHLVRKLTLAKWLSVRIRTKWFWVRVQLRPAWPNGWVFVYELSDSGFESSCSHLHWVFLLEQFCLKLLDFQALKFGRFNSYCCYCSGFVIVG